MSEYRYLKPKISWIGDHVMDSMKYIESVASDGFLKNLYTFKIAQVLLDSLDKTLDVYVVKERANTYFDMWLTLNKDTETIKINDSTFRYFIMTEYVDQLNNRLCILRHRLRINENKWKNISTYQKKLDKLRMCIEGVENLYKQLTNHELWNYILIDLRIIKSSSNYNQDT